MSENQTRAPDEFIPDPSPNPAPERISGVWVFNKNLVPSPDFTCEGLNVSFKSNGMNFEAFWEDGGFNYNYILYYLSTVEEHTGSQDSLVVYDGHSGWLLSDSFRTVDFGETEQEVPTDFYHWLTANAVQKTGIANIQIPITENGATTLATAGKYCDRNIDVQVEIPTFEAELEAEKAIEDGLLTNMLTEYYNDRIARVLRGNGFRDLTKLRIVKIPHADCNNTLIFCGCTGLEIAEWKVGIGYQLFNNCTALKAAVILGETTTNLWNTNSFDNSSVKAGTGFVYVPHNLVESYKKHTNWALFASQIAPFVNSYAELSAIDGAVYPRCWVRGQDKAYIYDGATWTEVTE